MAVNRLKGAFAAPRKGETFELRAGLVYEFFCDLVANMVHKDC